MASKSSSDPKTQGGRLSALVSSMIEADKFSDLTIKCQGTIFKVHRLVVCLQSKPLAAAVDGRWKESVNNEIILDDDKPEIVAKLVNFFYNETLDLSSATAADDDALFVIAKVYVIADKYDVAALKRVAVEEFAERLSKLGKTKPEEWKDKSFPKALKLIYEETPEADRGLKDVAVAFIKKRGNALLAWAPFAEVFKADWEIGFDLSMVAPQGLIGEVRCSHCHSSLYVYYGSSLRVHNWCEDCQKFFLKKTT